MSEEEKKAIEEIEKFKINIPIFNNIEEAELENKLNFHLEEFTNEIMKTISKDKDIIILKKVIQKQQKEIEMWKETENDYEHELARKDEEIEKQQKEIEYLKEVKYYYEISRISKDKIREKIEDVSNGVYDAKLILEDLLEE